VDAIGSDSVARKCQHESLSDALEVDLH
jgi:hypothetical protein